MIGPSNERTVLDMMVEAMVKPAELKSILVDKAWLIRMHGIHYRSPDRVLNEEIRRQLTAWLRDRHYPSKGRKRLLDKVVSEVMASYKGMLYACLQDDAREAERDVKTCGNNRYEKLYAQRSARAIRAKLAGIKVNRKKRKSQWQRQRGDGAGS